MASRNEEKLFHKLLSDYNSWIRPVSNSNDTVIVHFELFMSQLVKVDEINQIMIANLWLKLKWNDTKLQWITNDYGGVQHMRVSAEKTWKLEIVL
ncbi:unnamed protein product [Clavelina lepadiformis]|uniref:Neurotransmitter-gated ion-channel ligand-binding domain-containing protein n=1 Tax=Clavelina lepadiformis TaxID=159417 RepID=A0ABP0FJY7_CLALP